MAIISESNPLVVGALVVGAVAVLAVRFFAKHGSYIRVSSKLRNIPGPERPSGLAGFLTGHLGIILHRDGMPWHHEVVKTFTQGGPGTGAGVVQFNGLIGVCANYLPLNNMLLTDTWCRMSSSMFLTRWRCTTSSSSKLILSKSLASC